MAEFLAQYQFLIGAAVVVLLLFGGSVWSGVKLAGSFVMAHLPSLESLKTSGEVKLNYLQLAGLMLAVWLMAGGVKGCTLPGLPSWPSFNKADAVTYVHEQRSGSITPAIRAALSTLNEKGVLATEFDVDTVTKQGGQVPKQYVGALDAAKKVGLPAGVSTSKGVAIKTIKDPKAEDILALAP